MTKKGMVGLLLLVAVILGACGASPESTGSAPSFLPQEEPAMDKSYLLSDSDEGYRAVETAFDAAGGEVQVAAAADRMIIWNANLSLTVEDSATAIDKVQSLARDLGGYTVSTESWLEDDQLHARLTVRVPAESFEEAMSKLRALALEVDRESANSEDVTDQYVDLESRLRHLEVKEEQLLTFLEEAEDTEAVLAVYSHLAETQAEIEQVKGRMTYLEKLSAMATITVSLYPEEAEPPVVEEGWNPGRTLRNATRALVNALVALGKAIIWLGTYVLPLLVLVVVPIALVVRLLRRRAASRTKG